MALNDREGEIQSTNNNKSARQLKVRVTQYLREPSDGHFIEMMQAGLTQSDYETMVYNPSNARGIVEIQELIKAGWYTSLTYNDYHLMIKSIIKSRQRVKYQDELTVEQLRIIYYWTVQTLMDESKHKIDVFYKVMNYHDQYTMMWRWINQTPKSYQHFLTRAQIKQLVQGIDVVGMTQVLPVLIGYVNLQIKEIQIDLKRIRAQSNAVQDQMSQDEIPIFKENLRVLRIIRRYIYKERVMRIGKQSKKL